jgi:predicted TIM-barrel fold metal-dependent hydrolase
MRYEGLDLRTVFRRALEVVGPQRLLFGTDSSFLPRGWHGAVLTAQAEALYELGLSESDAQLILADNLQRVFS